MTHKLNGVVAIALLSVFALAQGPCRTTGQVHGVVFVVTDHGGRSVVPFVKVLLTGPSKAEIRSDYQGHFSFDSVFPGDYVISAERTGVAGARNIVVQAGTVSEVSLEMKLVAVAQSVTITASTDQVDREESSGSDTVAESAARNMPNIDRHFQSLLPFVNKRSTPASASGSSTFSIAQIPATWRTTSKVMVSENSLDGPARTFHGKFALEF